jgi:hypothetical protein
VETATPLAGLQGQPALLSARIQRHCMRASRLSRAHRALFSNTPYGLFAINSRPPAGLLVLLLLGVVGKVSLTCVPPFFRVLAVVC